MKSKEFIAEIRELDLAALKERAKDLRSEALKTRIRKVSGQLKTSHVATDIRKKIARVETVILEKTKK